MTRSMGVALKELEGESDLVVEAKEGRIRSVKDGCFGFRCIWCDDENFNNEKKMWHWSLEERVLRSENNLLISGMSTLNTVSKGEC